ncbi:hypothetical protein L211DRAFT_71691 [Terfezia boudieri ATCC MYA-4762]|uniref:HAUS augmin-like complex subunit 6 N-terminal domain-containing protein n=1 Tax=Terfezia boudieri ATCC MYA-4762 TaxID=1051890 RepID=A0A3N4LWS1_9PEZI|nr:hypothetical protein L211DRAFT_71691 [Terfezia boudieri ATCC MYA-4762]
MKASPAVSLLLTNLQLLDYYSSDGAFPISIETFTSLKNKGKAFEHIVHHLFHVYQPTEAATRFQACWPIYEPIQSKELRNIAFKWLSDLKKSGQLQTGGNVVIRRSLLDDCSGEKYEELLLALSTMVLRNQVEREVFHDKKRQTIAYKQCTMHTPSLGLLTPLTLAHQSSLTRLLASRNASKTQWATFMSLLRDRETELRRISPQLPQESVIIQDSDLGEDEVTSKWTSNWLGEDRWLEVLLHGDSEFYKDKLLELGYEKAIAKHQLFLGGDGIGKAAASTVSAVGLKAFEKQVEEQKKRVGELRKMREGATRSLGEVRCEPQDVTEKIPMRGDVPSPQSRGLHITFGHHLELQLHNEEAVTFGLLCNCDTNEYSILLEDVQAELETVESSKRRRRPRPVLAPFRPHSLQNDMGLDYKTEGQGALSRKTLLPLPATKLPKPGVNLTTANAPSTFPKAHGVMVQATFESILRAEPRIVERSPMVSNKRSTTTNPGLSSPPLSLPPNTRQRLETKPSSRPHEAHDRPLSAESTLSDELFSDIDESNSRTPPRSLDRSTERKETHLTSQHTPHQLPYKACEDNEKTPRPSVYTNPSKQSNSFRSPSIDDTEHLAEQIVSKITAANYSPERPSLVRRPSASPTRTNRFGFGFRSPEVSPIKLQSPGFNAFEHSTLLSLASPGSTTLPSSPLPSNIPIHPSSPDYRQPNANYIRLHLQRPEMHSSPERGYNHDQNSGQLHLSLDSVTNSPMGSISTDTTPKEELFVSEDYNSVFKSRPKVALSPSFSPIPHSGLGMRPGLGKGRLSPDYMSLNSAASTSGSEDGSDRGKSNLSFRGFGLDSPSSGTRGRIGGSRIPEIGRRKL